MYYMNYSEPHLEHHQVAGAHWGQRNGPPYPLLRDSMGRLKTKAQAKRKEASERRASAQNKTSEEKAAEAKEKLKKDILSHPKKLYEHRDEFTKDEIEELIKQINWDRRISEVSKEEHTRNVNNLMNLVRNIGTVAENANKTLQMFNTFKRFLDEDKK